MDNSCKNLYKYYPVYCLIKFFHLKEIYNIPYQVHWHSFSKKISIFTFSNAFFVAFSNQVCLVGYHHKPYIQSLAILSKRLCFDWFQKAQMPFAGTYLHGFMVKQPAKAQVLFKNFSIFICKIYTRAIR